MLFAVQHVKRMNQWQKGPFFPPHTSTAGYIMFYIIQGTLCKEMDLLTCYLHKSALYSWDPLFIAIVPLHAAMAVLEWTPTQREFGWGRMVSVKGQLINTHECLFFSRGIGACEEVWRCSFIGVRNSLACLLLLRASWKLLTEREKKRQCSDSRITISLATQVIALETTCQQARNTTMLQWGLEQD